MDQALHHTNAQLLPAIDSVLHRCSAGQHDVELSILAFPYQTFIVLVLFSCAFCCSYAAGIAQGITTQAKPNK
eukprot:126824-Amphidinium_carterae.2